MIGLFKKKDKQDADEKKDDNPLSSYLEDSVTRYINSQYTQTPKSYFKEVRAYWFIGGFLNVLSLILMLFGSYLTLDKNFSVELNLVRVDGGVVSESFDVRRSVMLKNALDRENLKKEIKAPTSN
jgi:hypothetical protein